MDVGAERGADATRDRARGGDARVLLALAVAGPAAASVILVVALGLADAAAGGAVLEHEVRVLLALVAVGRPVGAPRLYVAADVSADRARMRARFLDDLSVAALALLVVRPRGAGEIVVVAVAPCADGSTLERKAQQHDCDAARLHWKSALRR